MPSPVKTAQTELAQAFEDFKKANDEVVAQKADKGVAEALAVETLEKANAALTEAEKRLAERIDEVERNAQLAGSLGEKGCGALEENATAFGEFVSTERGGRERVVLTPEEFKAYDAAVARYQRVGDRGLTPDERAALSVGSDPAGGYWVQPDRSGRIVTKVRETSPMRSVAAVTTISTDALEGVYDREEAGSGWVGEKDDRDETDTAGVGAYRIPVHEQYAEPRITQKLLDDAAFDVEGWHGEKVSRRFTRQENLAFVSGDGVRKPRGFLAYTFVETADDARPWGEMQYVKSGAAAAFGSTDRFVDLLFALKGPYRANAQWAMARLTIAEVRKLKDGDGNYIWQPDFTQGRSALLLGRPIVEFDDMPAVAADALPVAIGDWQAGYQIVDRQGIRVLRDPYTKKGWVKLYTTKRVGGDVVDFDAIKAMKIAA